MLENNDLTDKKIYEMSQVLYNPELCREIGEYNFELGKKHFSYEVLEDILYEIFAF